MKLSAALLTQGILLLALGLACPGSARAQGITILHSIDDGSVLNEGSGPVGLIQGSDGYFYGTTSAGGSASGGTIFEITPQGQTVVVHNFGDGTVTNDGTQPQAALFQAKDGNFYGTTSEGGANSIGTIFKMSPRGVVTILHSFGDSTVTNDGRAPDASLIQGSDGNFYGTTNGGGSASAGTVFKITSSNTITILHSFGGTVNSVGGAATSDGTNPEAALIQGSDGNFYGTTVNGGANGQGTAFQITPQGVETILFSFGGLFGVITPTSALVQGTDGNFYGTTLSQNAFEPANGVIYKLTPQGGLSLLYAFEPQSVFNNILDVVTPEGSTPFGLLLGADGNFYGMTSSGGSAGVGTIYKVTPQGVETILHSFGDGTVINDGSSPGAVLVQGSDGNFYGATNNGGSTATGGSAGSGTLFKLNPALPEIVSSLAPTGTAGLPFSYQVKATNAPTAYTMTPTPSGLSIDPREGLISGTVASAGTTTVTITATNAIGTSTATLTITFVPLPLPAITSLLTVFGAVGQPFTYATTANNATTSYSSSDLTGTELSLDPTTGIISGSPTTAGPLSVMLTPTNATGPGAASTLTIQVSATPPTLSQEYVVLHNFSDGSTPNNADGTAPNSILQGFDGTFYGSSATGIFNMTAQGTVTAFASLTYSQFSDEQAVDTGADTIILASDGNFYVTNNSDEDGSTTGDILNRVTPQGIQFPLKSLGTQFATDIKLTPIQATDGNFYGTSYDGFVASGDIYTISPQGVLTDLHDFQANPVTDINGNPTTDGATPSCTLVQGSDGYLYGTAREGGPAAVVTDFNSGGYGSVYRISLQGQYVVMHNFGIGTVFDIHNNAVTDGTLPVGGLVEGVDGNYYGTTSQGGSTLNAATSNVGSGTIFRMTPQGSVTILHNFGDGSVTNDGSNPVAAMILGYDGNFYGTTSSGGAFNMGTVFEMTPTGTVTIIHSFAGSTVNDGALPAGFGFAQSGLIQATDGNIYGFTPSGGSASDGTIFAILAHQTATHVPIFYGSAYGTSPLGSFFTYTPKVAFGVSSGGLQPSGILDEIESMFTSAIHPAFSQTNWTLTGTLPTYLNFDSSSATISGTPTQSGTFTVTITPHNAIGDGQAQTVTLFIDVPPSISSPPTASGNEQSAFNYTITGLPPPTAYSATFLPGWLSVDISTGILSGTPPAPGTYAFDAVGLNYAGIGSEQVFLNVTGGASSSPAITSPTSVSASAGTPLTYPIVATNTPTSYSALILPVGLTFDPTTGIITGTPTTAGTFSCPISATNANGTTAGEITFAIANAGAPGLPASLSFRAAPNVPFSYQIPATGLVGLYTAIGLPTGLALNPTSGVISGTPTANGNSNISVTASNGKGSATSTLALNVGPIVVMPFTQWAGQYPSFTGSLTDITEKDGVPNLFKYLGDLDPTAPLTGPQRAALPVLGLDTTSMHGTKYLTLTFQEYSLLTGVTVNLQTSSDLVNWTTVTPDINQQVGTNTSTGDPIIEMGVIATGSKQFIRLDVSSP